MPAIAALSINDGQGTPAAHTFNPVTTDGTLAKWADRSPSIPAGWIVASHDVSGPSGNRTTNKIQSSFMLPTIASVDGVDKVVRYSSGQLTLNIHPESTLQERKDLLAYFANFLGLASVKTSVENVEPFY
jgi:hypothetical protein